MVKGVDYVSHLIIFTGIVVLAAGVLQLNAPNGPAVLASGLQIVFAGLILLALRSLR